MEPAPCRRPRYRWSYDLLPASCHLSTWALLLALVFLLSLFLPSNPTVTVDELGIAAEEVKTWALKFGIEASGGCAVATCVRKITENFNAYGATPEWVEATQMLEEMRTDVQNMMAWKTSAITKIRDVAELAVMKYTYDPDIKLEYYYNAKKAVRSEIRQAR